MQKKIMTLILIIMFLMSMTGCKQTSGILKSFKIDQTTAIKVTGVYKIDKIKIPEGYTIKKDNVSVNSGRIYALCTKEEKTNNEHFTYITEKAILFSVDINGENKNILPLDHTGFTYYENFNVSPDGSCYILSNNKLVKIDSDGTVTMKINLSGFFNKIITDNDGIIYISSQDTLLVLSAAGVKLYDIKFNNYNIIKAPDNKILAENIYTGYNSAPKYYYIDNENKKLSPYVNENITPPENVTAEIHSYSIGYGADYDIYYRNKIGVYGYNNGDIEANLLCDWVNSGIYESNTTLISVVSSNKMVCMIKDAFAGTYMSEMYDIAVLTKVSDDEVIPKIIITLAYTNTVDTVINAAINFNLSNDKYRVIFENYSVYNSTTNMTKSIEMLNLDLTNNKIPDIVIVNDNMPYDSYVEKGLFINLYEYFDSDTDITRDDIIYGVRTANETDGKLYCLPVKFTMETLIGKKSIVGDKPSLSLDEMYNLNESIPDDGSLFSMYDNKMILKKCLSSGIGDFIDYENGTCDFNGERFLKLLDFIDTYKTPEINYDNMKLISYGNNILSVNLNGINSLREDKTYFYEAPLKTADSFIFAKYIFEGEDLVYTGYPTNFGNGTIIYSDYLLSITNKSLCKEGAWEFIKYFLTDKIQTSANDITSTGFPVTVAAFYQMLESMKYYYYYVCLLDYQYVIMKEAEPLDEEQIKKSGDTLIRMTDNDIKSIMEFINANEVCNKYDKTVNDIIWEELNGFFEGSVSAEQAGEYIQSRVGIYLSERN